jgi:hypothetical protein
MLDSHISICIPPESHFFLWLEEKYGEWENRFLESYLEDLFQSTKFETWNLEKKEVRNFLKTQKINSYAKLNSLVYYFYSLKNNRNVSFWGDKNSLWIEKLYKIKEYYPQAFYIHIVRDGRDVACSYKLLNSRKIKSKYFPKLPDNVEEIAKTWAHNIKKIDNFIDTIDAKKTIQVSYEDLLKTPEVTLQRILDKLDLKFLKTQTEYYLKDKKEIEPEAFFAWKEKLKQPPDITNVGKYKNELTTEEIYVFNTLAKKTLLKYGYL